MAVTHLSMMDILKANKEIVAEMRDRIRQVLFELEENRTELQELFIEQELLMVQFQEVDQLSDRMSSQLKALVLAIEER